MAEVVLEVEDLTKHFTVRGRGVVRAVDGVSFSLHEGEVLGLVGESGSGKSTVGRCVTRLLQPTGGSVRLKGRDITHLSQRKLRPLRREMHIVFQDPSSSLNPRMTVGDIIGEPLRRHGLARGATLHDRVAELVGEVGLRPELTGRYPHELSGGQRQRVGLARALSVEPSLLVADEPTSALDVSVQASILNLLADVQRRRRFACLFITHDLAVVEFIANRVAVMYLGTLAEVAPREELFRAPKHPYSQALLSAAPVPDPVTQRQRRRVVLTGDLPSPLHPPSGCRFHTRCPLADERSRTEVPALRDVTGNGHLVACHQVAGDGTAPSIIQPAAASGG
ncbi:MAG TPA: oligopeptide/dipeptide ABC transporter ATP-binding protein [Actinomycetota bacterium]|jgi:oligopeptide/dipeptide ABC transporter ATP-binding protein|nr:oligopeptide/dipeptide ABC transporter ATP-binding protein [Actinomycetota bacterium]